MKKLGVAVAAGGVGLLIGLTIGAGYETDYICWPFGHRYGPNLMFTSPICQPYFDDGGKVCSDNNQCMGNCIASHETEIGSSVSGVCEAYRSEGWEHSSVKVKQGRAVDPRYPKF